MCLETSYTIYDPLSPKGNNVAGQITRSIKKGHLVILLVLYVCIMHGAHCIIFLLFPSQLDLYIHDFEKTHFKLQKSTLTKAVQLLSAPFFSKWPLYYHLTLRGYTFKLASCTGLKLMSYNSCLIVRSGGINNSD